MFGMMPWGVDPSSLSSGVVLVLHFDNSLTDATGLNTVTSSNTNYFTDYKLDGQSIACTTTAGKIEITGSTHIAPAGQDYCIECFLASATTVSSSENPIFDLLDASTGYRDIRLDVRDTVVNISRNTNGGTSDVVGNVSSSSYTRSPNTLYHIALYRIGNNTYFAMDGVVWIAFTQTAKTMATTKNLIIGNRSGVNVAKTANRFDDFRMIIGNGLVPYGASNFTPPSSPFPAS